EFDLDVALVGLDHDEDRFHGLVRNRDAGEEKKKAKTHCGAHASLPVRFRMGLAHDIIRAPPESVSLSRCGVGYGPRSPPGVTSMSRDREFGHGNATRVWPCKHDIPFGRAGQRSRWWLTSRLTMRRRQISAAGQRRSC